MKWGNAALLYLLITVTIQNQLSPLITSILIYNPAAIYLLKVNNRNTITRCEICSKLTIKTREPYFTPCYSVCIVNCEDVIAGWVTYLFYLDSIHKRPYFLKTSLHHNPLCQLWNHVRYNGSHSLACPTWPR